MSNFLTDDHVPTANTTNMNSYNEDWVKYVLEFPMPEVDDEQATKYSIVKMLQPVMNSACRCNVRRHEIPLHLRAYDIIWMKYFAYKRNGKRNPDLLVLKEDLREGFELMLTRGVEMGQMRMIFEPKQNIFQRFVDEGKKKVGFFKKKRPPEEEGY